jgi:hypothetical protein
VSAHPILLTLAHQFKLGPERDAAGPIAETAKILALDMAATNSAGPFLTGINDQFDKLATFAVRKNRPEIPGSARVVIYAPHH